MSYADGWLDGWESRGGSVTEVADLRRELERVDALRDVADGCAESLRAEVKRLTRERDRLREAARALVKTVKRMQDYHNVARYGLGTYRDVLDAADALAALLDSTGDDGREAGT